MLLNFLLKQINYKNNLFVKLNSAFLNKVFKILEICSKE